MLQVVAARCLRIRQSSVRCYSLNLYRIYLIPLLRQGFFFYDIFIRKGTPRPTFFFPGLQILPGMIASNKTYFKRVVLWSGGATAILAAASLQKYQPIVAVSLAMGAVIGILNLLSIIKFVEVFTASASGLYRWNAVRVVSGFIHLFKLAIIFLVLFLLAWFRLTDLLALIVGFTIVLIANLLAAYCQIRGQEQE